MLHEYRLKRQWCGKPTRHLILCKGNSPVTVTIQKKRVQKALVHFSNKHLHLSWMRYYCYHYCYYDYYYYYSYACLHHY